MAPPIAILIADDHPIVRKGLRDVIDAEADLNVVAEADDGRAALLFSPLCAPPLPCSISTCPKWTASRSSRRSAN